MILLPLIDEMPQILAALAPVPGVAAVHEGWPKTFEQLPCIAVEEAGNTPTDFRDDKAYVTELEYTVRVFAVKAEEKRAIASAIEGTDDEPGPLPAMGYTRTFSWDDDSADVRQKVMRYKKIL